MNLKFIGSVIVLILFVFAALIIGKMTGNMINSPTKVKLETNYGDIVIQLYKDMPITAGNFPKILEQEEEGLDTLSKMNLPTKEEIKIIAEQSQWQMPAPIPEVLNFS